MNRSIIFVATASASFALLLGYRVTAAGEALLIENVTLLSPEQAQPLGNRYVLVRDGRIAAVSDRIISAEAGARRLDGTVIAAVVALYAWLIFLILRYPIVESELGYGGVHV
jgi:hypothetical protein